MTVLWHFYWPVIVAGLVVGVVTGMLIHGHLVTKSRDRLDGRDTAIGDKRQKQRLTLTGGIALTLGLASLWHAPLGAGERLATAIEGAARAHLDHFEMRAVTARLDRSPLRRRLLLSGQADDFQRSELLRMMGGLPGVSEARWRRPRGVTMPLVVEACGLSLVGFSLGLLLAYLLELRRRANAEWRW